MTIFEPGDDPESRRARAEYETVPDRKWWQGAGGCWSGCAGWVTVLTAVTLVLVVQLA